jgi:heptaprenyl diphosphate synthase
MLMKAFEQFRLRRKEVYEGLFSARALCVAGLLIMPALLFNPITAFRVVQFFFFWFLAWLAGKKNNPFITILIILGITAFNLIVPYGQVLFSIGKFKITLSALLAGIHRAVTLEGLIMLSRVSVRSDLRFPGAFGELVGESFRIFALVVDSKHRITRKNLIGDIDQLMIDLSGEVLEDAAATSGVANQPVPAVQTKTAGFIIIAAVTILAWLPWGIVLLSQSDTIR